MDKAILSCRKLSKKFGNIQVLNGVDLEIKKGEVFCLLGANGAGKTTLIKCILQFLEPSEGQIFFRGGILSWRDIQSCFSYIPESFQLYRELSAYELLRILSLGLKNRTKDPSRILSLVGLKAEQYSKKIKTYSRGMLQRVGLAVCLAKDPEIIIMDDPFLGLDILGQVKMIEVIRRLKDEGRTIFFSSHIFSHVEKIADSLAVIDKGVLRFQGSGGDFLRSREAANLEEAFLKELKYYEKNNSHNPA